MKWLHKNWKLIPAILNVEQEALKLWVDLSENSFALEYHDIEQQALMDWFEYVKKNKNRKQMDLEKALLKKLWKTYKQFLHFTGQEKKPVYFSLWDRDITEGCIVLPWIRVMWVFTHNMQSDILTKSAILVSKLLSEDWNCLVKAIMNLEKTFIENGFSVLLINKYFEPSSSSIDSITTRAMIRYIDEEDYWRWFVSMDWVTRLLFAFLVLRKKFF